MALFCHAAVLCYAVLCAWPCIQVAVLFRNHNDLLTEFTYFLPDNSPQQVSRAAMRRPASSSACVARQLKQPQHASASKARAGIAGRAAAVLHYCWRYALTTTMVTCHICCGSVGRGWHGQVVQQLCGGRVCAPACVPCHAMQLCNGRQKEPASAGATDSMARHHLDLSHPWLLHQHVAVHKASHVVGILDCRCSLLSCTC